ncbi:hypothetical protein GGR58DRAFT_521274 [Xylaria digitata]|nr:hypothetical protein GGR58DRAFT_521274 [Xylaria digitata]
MASHPDPEKALTCKLPSRENAPFLRFNCPDWSKIDIIGQTVILVELTSHFGSFQNTCRALRLQSNELESFLQTYLHYQEARERGALKAEQWGREQAVPANDDEDIPQQRPVFISPSSIAPACDFLSTMGYHEHIPAVQSWSRRIVVWPPHIDVSHIDISELDQVGFDIVLPQPRQQRIHSTHVSCLGDDTRALIALTGAWNPKADGTPDAAIAFIDLPDGAAVYGPRGPRKLTGSGRYYVCWPTDGLLDNQYNDLVLARNAFDHRASQDADAFAGQELANLDPQVEDLNGQGPLEEKTSADLIANPKDIFGTDVPNTHSVSGEWMNPFHPQTEPQGPSRKLGNPGLLQVWDSWPGQIFQFRLPHGYTILGPQNRVLTFDPHEHERYDDLGDPHGIGGTYLVVLPMKTPSPVSFRIQELPADVILRFKISERLVIIRNGMVLPRFVEQGVHEWSTREGFLDLYGAHGCYEVFHRDDGYSIFPEVVGEPVGQGTDQEHEHRDEHDNGHSGELVEHNRNIATNPSPLEEAAMILAPYRDWLDSQEEEEEKRLDREAEKRVRLDAKIARDKAHRDVLLEERVARKLALGEREAREQERIDAILREDTTTAQRVQNRRVSKKQGFENQPTLNQGGLPLPKPQPRYTRQQQQQQRPSGSSTVSKPEVAVQIKATPNRGKASSTKGRRRIADDEDEDYTPASSHKPTSTQKKPTLRKSQEKLGNGARGIGDPQSTPVFKGRQTRATSSQTQIGKSTIGPAPGLRPSTVGTRSSRTVVQRKPIGPLLDAIQANDASGNRSLQLPRVPKVNDGETAPDGNAAGGTNRMVLRARTAKPPAVLDESFVDDPNETESEGGF